MDYSGKQALVLGLGESGLAMARWLNHCGAIVRVADTREAPARLSQLQEQVGGATFISGEFHAELLADIDFVALSPGLKPHDELAAVLPVAQSKNIPVWGEIELFAQALRALKETQSYAPKVIAITGTNGKTTVTSLTGLLCERAGLRVQVAGNISPAALDVLQANVEQNTLPDVWVLELSSFQLHSTYSLEADAATVLNLTQDHLDWHGDMDAYAADKSRIFGKNTVRVLNRHDARVMDMRSAQVAVSTFGVDAPEQANSFGLCVERGMEWLSVAVPEETFVKKSRRKKVAPEDVPVQLQKLMPSEALKIKGRHNATNALAALALCRAISLPFAPLLHALREYKGEAHRVEFIANISGVDYVDDSKGTNVGATVAALDGLGKAEGAPHLVLILGGDGKGQDFSPLVSPISRHVHTILLIGQDAKRIGSTVSALDATQIYCETLPDAVEQAAQAAGKGDVVLLSPACASMDMFQNYTHRAQVFCDAVREIALSRGEVML